MLGYGNLSASAGPGPADLARERLEHDGQIPDSRRAGLHVVDPCVARCCKRHGSRTRDRRPSIRPLRERFHGQRRPENISRARQRALQLHQHLGGAGHPYRGISLSRHRPVGRRNDCISFQRSGQFRRFRNQGRWPADQVRHRAAGLCRRQGRDLGARRMPRLPCFPSAPSSFVPRTCRTRRAASLRRKAC